MVDQRTIAVYDAKAGDYAKLTDNDAPDADLQRFIDALPAGGNVLDLGCGPGQAAAFMANAGLAVDAFDASPAMVALAQDRLGDAVKLASFDDLSAVETYDGIWANFSLLHASREDLPRHLAAIAAALRDGGIFHIGMKTGDGTTRDSIDRLYTYVTEDALAALLQDAGFSIFHTRTGTDRGLSGEMSDFVIMLGRKNG